MIIDNKGRIFGKINVFDLAVATILILFLFIAIKFTFFKPNYFHYEDVTAEVLFENISLNELLLFHDEDYLLYSDNESYISVSGEEFVECINKNFRKGLFYYFNESYTRSDNITRMICINNADGQGVAYFLNDSVNISDENDMVSCYNISYTIKNGGTNISKLEADDYLCKIKFLFNLKARIIDNEPFYKDYGYHISEGGFFEATVNNITFRRGKIVSVYDGPREKDNEKP